MSSSQPFDLFATKGELKRFIEVKGTTGDGFSVVLTQGEVNHIRGNAENCALVIVSGIVLEKKSSELEARGGNVSTHDDPWTLIDANLNPTQYRYAIT